MSNHRSKTTQTIGIRLKNEDIEVLDAMVEAGGFANRADCLRAFIRPSFEMARAAMEKKSWRKILSARMAAEVELNVHMKNIQKNSEVQGDLFGDLPEMGVLPA